MKNKYTMPEIEKCKEVLDNFNEHIADMFKEWRKN